MTDKKKVEPQDAASRTPDEAEVSAEISDGQVADNETPPEIELCPEEELARERDDFKDRWLRAVAEQDNLRKRTRREVTDARRFAIVELVRELLEVLDNFERAAASTTAEEESEPQTQALRSGLDLIHGRFGAILAGRGLEAVAAEIGQTFDPTIHEAVMRIENEDMTTDQIVEVAQKGYRLDDIVLRPARVIVAQ